MDVFQDVNKLKMTFLLHRLNILETTCWFLNSWEDLIVTFEWEATTKTLNDLKLRTLITRYFQHGSVFALLNENLSRYYDAYFLLALNLSSSKILMIRAIDLGEVNLLQTELLEWDWSVKIRDFEKGIWKGRWSKLDEAFLLFGIFLEWLLN